MSLTGMAAAHAAGLSLDQVPVDVQVRAKEALRDHLACVIAGSETDLSVLVTQALAAGVDGPAPLLGTRRSTVPGLAAFCNATAANAMDFDDTSGAGHPGASVIPAALAAAAMNRCDGRHFLEAIIAGYEVGMRVARAIKPSWPRYQQVHGIGSAQVFGAAAAAGHVLGLDQEAMECAFGIAGSMAPVPHAGKYGWNERPLTWVKDNVSWPAENGFRAATLARAGMPANRTILDGDKGFWVMAGSDQFEPSSLEDYGGFELVRLSFKPYPCCRWLHTTLDALDRLQRECDLRFEAVESVEVDTTQTLAEQFVDRTPQTMVDAEFSLPHAVSMKLMRVDVTEWWMAANRFGPKVLQMMARVRARHDPTLTQRYLDAGRQNGCIPSRVRVVLAGGQRLESYEEVALGEPVNPLSEEAQLDKFHRLTARAMDDEARMTLLERLVTLEALGSVDQLLSTL